MKLKIKFDVDQAKAKVKELREKLKQSLPLMLQDDGRRLVGLSRIYFDSMSKGGTGFDGRKWPMPQPETIIKRQSMARRGLLQGPVVAQGVVSGRLQASLEYEITGNKLKVSYSEFYANFFSKNRPLFPSKLPKPWRWACDRANQYRINAFDRDPKPH